MKGLVYVIDIRRQFDCDIKSIKRKDNLLIHV